MAKGYSEDLLSLLRNRKFVVSLAILMLLAYGFALFNPTISIDDLEGNRFTGAGNMMLASGRFSFWIWAKLSGYGWFYFSELLGTLLLGLGAMNMCILFRRVSRGGIPTAALTAFGGVYLTYPLWAEIWEFSGTTVNIGAGILLSTFSIFILYDYLHHKEERRWWQLPVAAGMMMLVCAGYESVVAVYIFLVFAVLAFQVVYGEEQENNRKEMIRQGLVYAGVLAAGLVLRVVVHKIILLVCGIEPQVNGDTSILWGEESVFSVICMWTFTSFLQYVLKGFINFAVAELHFCVIVLLVGNWLMKKKYGKALGLPVAGMLFSLVAISLVQGIASEYRSCQVWAVFVGFVVMLVVAYVMKINRKERQWIKRVTAACCCVLCLYQSGYINNILQANHIRSEEEAHVVREIGTDLHRSFDMEKPVVFVGRYELSSYVTERVSVRENSPAFQLCSSIYYNSFGWLGDNAYRFAPTRKFTEWCNISVLSWAVNNYGQEPMLHIFEFYNYPYLWVEDTALLEDAKLYAQEVDMPGYPAEGYIEDRGSYIIVNLG